MVTHAELLDTRAELEAIANNMASDPAWIAPFIERSIDVAVGTLYGTRDGAMYGIEPDRPEELRADAARRWIRRSARASALLYGRLAFPDREPPIEIVDGVALTRLAKPFERFQVSVDGWVEALFRAMSVGDAVSLSWLTNIPTSFLADIARENAECVAPHVFTLGALVCSLVKRDGQHVRLLERAVVEVGEAANVAGTRASEIDEPAILSIAALLADEDYTRRILDLAERHERFYSTLEPLRNWISVRGISVQRLARSMGVIVFYDGPTLCSELVAGA